MKTNYDHIPAENYESRDEYIDALFNEIDLICDSNYPSDWTQNEIQFYFEASEYY